MLGHGVPKNEAEAVKWFRKAADQGCSSAQESLGDCYAAGRGIPKDNVLAYMWFHLAAEQANPVMMDRMLPKEMTSKQIEEAEKLIKEWKLKKSLKQAPHPNDDEKEHIDQSAPDMKLITSFAEYHPPFSLVTTQSVNLLDAAGKEIALPSGSIVDFINRTPGGTMTVNVNGNAFIGNESRLIGKSKLKK